MGLREFLTLPGIFNSQGVSDGKYLYISGQIAWNEQGELVGHDIRTQVRRAFENLGLVLQETVSFIIKS